MSGAARVTRRSAGASARATASYHRQTRLAHAAETAEDYVESIGELIAREGEARVTELSLLFGVTHVTVNKTIARLQREGLVKARPYRAIFLTPKGERMAQRVRRRHELVVEFLRTIGVSEGTARHDAEGIEHHVSVETLRAFARVVGKTG